jgi:hypothetical protein
MHKPDDTKHTRHAQTAQQRKHQYCCIAVLLAAQAHLLSRQQRSTQLWLTTCSSFTCILSLQQSALSLRSNRQMMSQTTAALLLPAPQPQRAAAAAVSSSSSSGASEGSG